MTTATVSLKLDDVTRGRVKNLALQRDRSPHWLMREAILQYVDREERRAQLRQSALAAWRDYEMTGLHLTADEADLWLARLEAGETVPAPACHD